MPAREPASAEELRAELDRVRRESLRAEAELARAEELKARLDTRDQEIEQLRESSREVLRAAEQELSSAAQKLAELAQQPPQARELDEARMRAARLLAELEDVKRQLEVRSAEADAARASMLASHAAAAGRDVRATDAPAAAQE